MDSEVTNLAFVKGLTSGISNGNVLVANAAVADDDFLKVDGTSIEGRSAAEMRSDLNVADGATATDAPAIRDNSGTPAFASGITKAEVLSLLGIENPKQHLRTFLSNNSLSTVTAGTRFVFDLANTSNFTSTPNTTDILIIDDTSADNHDYIELKKGGMYLVVVSAELFTSSGTAAQDFFLELGNGQGDNVAARFWGIARRKVKASSVSSDCAWAAQKTVVIDVPSGGSDEKLYIATTVNGVNYTVRAFDNSRTNITVTKIGDSTS
tara:strand:- start:774 stop:1571 length:798 start_codon:yes stop_codon:yes gene_type:complete